MHVIGAAQHPHLAVPDGDADPLGLGGRPRWLGVPIAGTMGRVSNTRGAAHTAQPQLSRTHPPPIAGAAAAATLLPSPRPPPPRSPPTHHPIAGRARVMHAAHLEEESCGARRRRRELRRRRNTPDSDALASHLAPLLPLLPLLPPLQVHSMHTRADWELVRKEMRELADPHVHERCAWDASRTHGAHTPSSPPAPPSLP